MRPAFCFMVLLVLLSTRAFSGAGEPLLPLAANIGEQIGCGRGRDFRGYEKISKTDESRVRFSNFSQPLTTANMVAVKPASVPADQRLRLRCWQYGRLLLEEYVGVEPPLVVGSRVSTPSRVDSGTWIYDFNNAFCVWR